ncbi:ead/Ea22-like family protein [Shigella boydii]|nr:ead/Ea22-like family protein [Shigella boydii]
MSEINYQALREAAERAIPAMERLLMLPADDDLLSEQELKDYGVDIDALNAFKFLAGPETVLALLDERERNQQYIKSRDQENEDIALTVGKLRVELEAAKKCIAELESNCGALVAECQSKKAALEAILSHCPINHPDIDIACIANIAHNELGEAKSSTSKASLVEIQAQGVEAFALTMRDTGDDPFFDSVASACADAADRFAAQLRKGGNQ